MEKIKVKFHEEKRSIDVTYQIKNKEADNKLFYAITDIARENKLNCTFGEDDYGLRYMHISGKKDETVLIAYNRIKVLE